MSSSILSVHSVCAVSDLQLNDTFQEMGRRRSVRSRKHCFATAPPHHGVPCVSPVLVSCIRPTIQGVLCVPLNSSVSCPTLNSGVFSTLPISSIVLCPIPLSRLRAESLVRASSVLKFEPDLSWPQLFKHPLQVVFKKYSFLSNRN